MNHGLLRFIAPLLFTLLSVNAQAVEGVIYYHNDALGSPIATTDQEGRVVWRKSYTPYGQPITQTAPNEPGYTGKFEETALGISDFGARWYDPRIGRFLAIDPVGFDPQNPQSFNRYAYANNNPYGFVDPNGESPLDVGFFIVDTVSLGVAVYSGNPEAIASAGIDLAASAVGLASPIPGTGLAIKAARAADKVADVVKAADSAKPLYRSMSRAEAEAVRNTGKLRGGREGETFYTDSRFGSAKKAQDRLSLDQLPEVQMEFRLRSNPNSVRNGTKVRPANNGRGGGKEYSSMDPVEVEITNVQPYR